jgi:lipoprotein-releasing system permease protein
MARIESVAGNQVEAMAPAMETYGLMQFRYGGQTFTRQVQVFGVRPEERARTGDFAEFLVDEKGERIKPSFDVPESLRIASSPAGQVIEGDPDSAINQLLRSEALEQVPDDGAVIGWAMGTVHREGKDEIILHRGDTIRVIYPRAGQKPEPGADDFTVVGYFKSGMSENDSMHIYVPLERFQHVRRLIDEQGRGAVNQIQIKVRPGVNLDSLKETLQTALEDLRPMYFRVATWEQKQGPLLSAVAVEQSILNMLLFFIIAVAGFGILAIFSMIVVEKTRDIGVMKALGASTSGVRGIFLGYGLLLGAVGSGVGMAGGLLFVHYINNIEKWLSNLTGRKVFDDSIYYFNEIPTLVEPWTVCWIVGGALFIAAAASVWPAQRASKLQPVRALRFE